MTLHTWVSGFVVDHGRVTEEGGRLRSFQRRRLDEPDIDLHVLHEPSGARGEELGSQALEAIGRFFLQDRLSVTGAVVRALQDTHNTLLDWNRRSLPRDQVAIGVTAAVVSENVAYVVQAGPGLVYHRRGGRLRRLEHDSGTAPPLGEGTLEPPSRRIELGPGDLVLVASPVLETMIAPGALEELLARGSGEALPEIYLATRDLPNFALFLISCVEIEEDARSPGEQGGPHSIAPGASGQAPRTGSQGAQPDTRTERPRASTRTAGAAGGNGHRDAAPDEPPVFLMPAPPPPIDISRPVVRLRSDHTSGRLDYARTTGAARRLPFQFSNWRLFYVLAGVAVVLAIVALVPDLVREGRGERLAELVELSQLHYGAAEVEADPATRRFYLEETRRLAGEALRMDELNQAALDLQAAATGQLQAMDAVFELNVLTTITTLSGQLTGALSINSLGVHAGVAYMLDTAGHRVIAVPVDGSAPPYIVYQDGETYDGTPAKAPIQIAWEGPEHDGRLFILDADRKLFELVPGLEPRPLPLRRTSTWASVAELATYDGNLYVLDPEGRQVHRYLPSAEGYDSEPSTLLARQSELGTAVGFAVDGDVYVIYRDGKVNRFVGGQPAGFSLGGIDRPIDAAIDIAVVAPADEVYIADSGNKRVVIAGRDGVFHRQLVSTAFTDMRAIAIDASGAQLYVVVGDALLTAPIVR